MLSSDSRIGRYGLGANVRICHWPTNQAIVSTDMPGERLWDAITTALGKRKPSVVAVGTLRHDCACRRRLMVAVVCRSGGSGDWAARLS